MSIPFSQIFFGKQHCTVKTLINSYWQQLLSQIDELLRREKEDRKCYTASHQDYKINLYKIEGILEISATDASLRYRLYWGRGRKSGPAV